MFFLSSRFLAVILASIGMYLAVISSSPSLTLPATILYFATFFVSNFVIYLPPIQLSVHWLTCYAIDACIQNLRFWRQNLNVDCGDRDSEKWAQFKNEKVPTSADAGKRVRTFALDEGFAALRDATGNPKVLPLKETPILSFFPSLYSQI